MKLQDVLLKAMAKKITRWEGAEIIEEDYVVWVVPICERGERGVMALGVTRKPEPAPLLGDLVLWMQWVVGFYLVGYDRGLACYLIDSVWVRCRRRGRGRGLRSGD